ncbi:MAG: hypothetical protein EAZ77_02515 [Nostocales cyanobacterium]|nr:MAG: hypothetical protein EAZ77_02515 [Nostocales cyanobacterium]
MNQTILDQNTKQEFRRRQCGLGVSPSEATAVQESGVRVFEKLLNYQIGIFGVSLKKLTADD